MLASVKSESLSEEEVTGIIKTEYKTSSASGSLCNHLRIDRVVSLVKNEPLSDEEENANVFKSEDPETGDSESPQKDTILQDVNIKTEPSSDEYSEMQDGNQSLFGFSAGTFDEGQEAAPGMFQNPIKSEDDMEDAEMSTDDEDSNRTNKYSSTSISPSISQDVIKTDYDLTEDEMYTDHVDFNKVLQNNTCKIIEMEALLSDDLMFTRDFKSFLGSGNDKRNAHENALLIFRHFNVIPGRMHRIFCPQCDVVMRINSEPKRSLGFRFRCPTCSRRVDPTTNTFLESIKLNGVGAEVVLQIILCFLTSDSLADVLNITNACRQFALKAYQKCRDVTHTTAWHHFEVLGGAGDIVEVERNPVFIGRGVLKRECWLVSGISRTTRKVFGAVVPESTIKSLLPQMAKHIHRDSWIVSDSCPGYRRCRKYFRGHSYVDSKRNSIHPPRISDPLWFPRDFFNPECTDTLFHGPSPRPNPPLHEHLAPVRWHTQHAERAWEELMAVVSKCNNPADCSAHIGEWMWRRNVVPKGASIRLKFILFMENISSVFPGPLKRRQRSDMDLCTCAKCS